MRWMSGAWVGFWLVLFAPVAVAEQAFLPVVLTGADRLAGGEFAHLIQNKKIGVLAHHASRLADGTHLVDWLHGSETAQIKMIFAPEHGFRGQADAQVPDYVDTQTGLPVYSLYGPRKAPTQDQLSQVDLVVADLQDVGVRFYTYGATLALVLQAAAQAGKSVVLLDRPNPLGGEEVAGAMLESDLQGGITAMYPIPMLHGMTIGELVELYNQEFAIGADLRVVPLSGWTRSMKWSDTGLAWHSPSPALPASDQAGLYSWFGALEALPLAVGRGVVNDQAFRIYGAPWITPAQAARLGAALRSLSLSGLEFEDVEWVPTRREYEGQLCRGFRVKVRDAQAVDGFRSLLEVLRTLRAELGPQVELQKADKALGAHWVSQMIESGRPTSEIQARARTSVLEFLALRSKYLKY